MRNFLGVLATTLCILAQTISQPVLSSGTSSLLTDSLMAIKTPPPDEAPSFLNRDDFRLFYVYVQPGLCVNNMSGLTLSRILDSLHCFSLIN